MDPKLRNLLRQGERADRVGKRQAAEHVYRQAADEFPDSAEAWLGLSRVVENDAEREAYYRRAVQLDPSLAGEQNSEEAQEVNPLDAVMSASQEWLEQSTRAPEASVTSSPAPRPVLHEHEPEALPADEVTMCAYHPTVEATLRCNRCNKPICIKCAVRTPVGYRCKACINEQQETFYSAFWYDHVLAAVVALPLAALASYIIFSIGWLTIFVAPFAGVVVAEAVRLVTRRRRGRWMPLVVGACIVLGSLPGVGVWLLDILDMVSKVGLPGSLLMDLVWQGVYLVLAVSSAVYRVK